MMDIDYVEMLENGMPPTTGHGQSERVFWFFEDITAREGVFFPQMRKRIDETTKEIYGITEKANKNSEPQSDDIPAKTLEFTVEAAKKMLDELVEDDYQKLHANMVAEAMKGYAKRLGEDENLWYLTGLLHDLDYFIHPNEHPQKSVEWFKKWGFPEELIHAVEAHAHMRTGVKPKSKMAAALIAIDELAGFLYAYSLMRENKFVGMEPKSVKKKFKDKAFARKVDREDIKYGIDEFAVDFDEHIEFLIEIYNDFFDKIEKDGK